MKRISVGCFLLTRRSETGQYMSTPNRYMHFPYFTDLRARRAYSRGSENAERLDEIRSQCGDHRASVRGNLFERNREIQA